VYEPGRISQSMLFLSFLQKSTNDDPSLIPSKPTNHVRICGSDCGCEKEGTPRDENPIVVINREDVKTKNAEMDFFVFEMLVYREKKTTSNLFMQQMPIPCHHPPIPSQRGRKGSTETRSWPCISRTEIIPPCTNPTPPGRVNTSPF